MTVSSWSRVGTCNTCGKSLYEYTEGNKRSSERRHAPGVTCDDANPDYRVRLTDTGAKEAEQRIDE